MHADGSGAAAPARLLRAKQARIRTALVNRASWPMQQRRRVARRPALGASIHGWYVDLLFPGLVVADEIV